MPGHQSGGGGGVKTSPAGIALIKEFEGCELKAYPDPGTGGDPWTIGYGHTGPDVKPGLEIDQQTADELLRADLEKFEHCVAGMLYVEVTQNQFDALVAFAFNCGCKALRGSTLMLLINEGNADAAKQQFSRWTKAGGRVMAGLVRRRQAEAELFGVA